MMANLIVLAALVLGGLYFGLWFWKTDLRRHIEEPKQRFQQQVEAHDARSGMMNGEVKGRD